MLSLVVAAAVVALEVVVMGESALLALFALFALFALSALSALSEFSLAG